MIKDVCEYHNTSQSRKQQRKEPSPNVQKDEAHIHNSHTGTKNWGDDCVLGLLASSVMFL
jgi:hypothetical protein